MSEMVERVARAVCKANGTDPDNDDFPPCDWRNYVPEANAAIAAMREPTGAMIDAGANSYGVPTPAIGSLPLSVLNGQPSKAWKTMIDEALRDG